jgi:hypothetical protein
LLEVGLRHAVGDELVRAWLASLSEADRQADQGPASTPVDAPAA